MRGSSRLRTHRGGDAPRCGRAGPACSSAHDGSRQAISQGEMVTSMIGHPRRRAMRRRRKSGFTATGSPPPPAAEGRRCCQSRRNSPAGHTLAGKEREHPLLLLPAEHGHAEKFPVQVPSTNSSVVASTPPTPRCSASGATMKSSDEVASITRRPSRWSSAPGPPPRETGLPSAGSQNFPGNLFQRERGLPLRYGNPSAYTRGRNSPSLYMNEYQGMTNRSTEREAPPAHRRHDEPAAR